MSAGESARQESQRAKDAAERLRRRADDEERRGENFRRGAASESRTAELLGPLSAYGFHLLHDRRWSGTSGNIDHLVVGPSGVFVVDTKDWVGELTLDAHGLWQGQDSREDVLESVQQVADLVRDGLAGLGLPPTGVRPVVAFHRRDDPCVASRGVWLLGAERLPRQLLSSAKNLTQGQAELILRSLMKLFPPALDGPVEQSSTAEQATDDPAVEGQPSALAADDVPGVQPPEDALFSREDLEDDALQAAMRAPLEDWMVFLHPRQADFARRRFNGPALLRGSAGTGKTVVALHRMAYLAERRASSLLFLSFVRTLPAVQRSAYQRLSPATVDRVEFASLHGWATKLLATRGRPIRVRAEECERAYRDAWREVAQGGVLDRPGSWVYWSEEVKQVLRGRRIGTLEQYQATSRTGRGSRLGSVQREAVWQLKARYEGNLRERGLLDWEDLLVAALEALQAEPLAEPYSSVVVDEVQDLTMNGVMLVSHLAADGPDSLLLVGDSHQAVFAGGVSPRQAGINVSGRSTVLGINYRNTAEIIEFAAPLVAEDDDVLGDGESVDPTCEVTRHGLRPLLASAETAREIDLALVSCLQRTRAAGRTGWGGMAVLSSRVRDVERYQSLLVSEGIPTIALEQWSGDRIDAVKVGTIKRAKGLEFLFVFLPGVDAALAPGGTAPLDEVERERFLRARRELYVASTRARDGLWVGTLAGRHAPPVDSTLHSPAGAGSIPTQPGGHDASDVYMLAREVLSLDVDGAVPRFVEPGWVVQGELGVACHVCEQPLFSFRRPYESSGKHYRYWALACTSCRTLSDLASLPKPLQKELRKRDRP